MRLALLLVLMLAGCTGPDWETRVRDGDIPLEFAEDIHDSLYLVGTIETCDAGYCVNATATNEGTATYHVDAICVTPWGESMTRDGEPVYPREPMAHCGAFGTEPFETNEQRTASFTWDGRIWNDATGDMDAGPGEYVWHITFRAYASAEGGEPIVLDVAFPVSIQA